MLLAGPPLTHPLQNQGFPELNHFSAEHAVAVVKVDPGHRRLTRSKGVAVKSAALGRSEFRLSAVRQRYPVVSCRSGFRGLAERHWGILKGGTPRFEQKIAVVAHARAAQVRMAEAPQG